MKTLPEKKKYEGPVKSLENLFSGGLEFIWLGQSGFIFSTGTHYIMADAYLSDYLGAHQDSLPYNHDRMIPPPVEESVLYEVDYVLFSHGHEDHLDPDLVRKLTVVNPEIVYLAPPGCRKTLLDLGAKAEKVKDIYYDKEIIIDKGFTINACPAAHPSPLFDAQKTWALSYRLQLNGKSIFFAGDTTVYPRLTDWLISKQFDLLILPVNGRDPVMERNGIVGNMNIDEGLILSAMLDTPMLGAHFGMFRFNTVDSHSMFHHIENFGMNSRAELAELDTVYSLL